VRRLTPGPASHDSYIRHPGDPRAACLHSLKDSRSRWEACRPCRDPPQRSDARRLRAL